MFDPAVDLGRRLLSARKLTGLDSSELAGSFESFGNDCEFGFFQRWCKSEAIGAFRFSNPHHSVVLQDIETNFESFGLDTEVVLDSQKPRRKWIIVDRRRRLREHTFIWEGDQTEEAVCRLARMRAAYQKRMMTENLRDGRKIFVIKSAEGHLDIDVVKALWRALRRLGPNWLLWVEAGDDVGRVSVIEPGLMRGEIDRLKTQSDGAEPSFDGWLALTTNAYVAVRSH